MLISMTEGDLDEGALHELARQFDATLAEMQQCDADPPVDDGVSARQGDLRDRVRRQQRDLEAAGWLPPGQSWWVRLQIATYNLHNYSAADAADRADQRALIRSLGADVLCVQEIQHRTDDPHDPKLAELFAAFCDDLGMDGRLAYARSGQHTGVLWRPGLQLRSWQDYRHWPWHHTCGVATLDVDARQSLHVAAAHFSPFDAGQRAHEAQLLGAVVPAGAEWMIAGLDLNAPSVRAPEPYAGQDPRGRHQLHQRITHDIWPATSDIAPVDRRAAMLLDRHSLRDLAERTGQTDLASSGHHPADPHGPRCPDCLRATPALAAIAGGVRVHDTPAAQCASDHLPLSATLILPWRPTFQRSSAATRTEDSGSYR